MKKLTMTRVLTPLAALAFTLGAQATAVSTDGFESYSDGASVTNATGWSFTAGTDGAPDASTVATYAGSGVSTPSVLPDGTTAGSNFLKLSTEDGILFRNMDGTAAGDSVDLYQGLYVDTDVQFTLTDKSDRPTPDGADKFIIWLEADEDAGTTNLCVWAREYQVVEGTGIAANSNKVYTLDSASIVPGEWHRLTVKAIAQTFTMQKPIPGFQVYLDNTLLTSSQTIVPDDQYSDFYREVENTTLGGLVNGQLKFFPAMADSLTALSQVGFSGEGKIDNLVVTRDLPLFEEPTTVRFDFDTTVIDSIDIRSLGATLTSTNDTVSVAPGATFTFEIHWKTGYSAAMFNIATSASANYATVSDYTVTAVSFGTCVITVATTAKDTTDVTFTWDALNDAMGEQVTENTAIKFTIGENVYNADILNETSYTINGVKTGTNILVTVEFSNNKWIATFPTLPECMSANGMTLTLDTRPESGAVTVSISAEAAPAPVTVNGTGYDTLAEALAAAVSGDTITFNTDVAAAGTTLTTAASTIDLNGHALIGTAPGAKPTISFTGLGAATIKGGVISNCYDELTIKSPAGQNLTIEDMTFHCSVKPQTDSDAALVLVTNCVFLCDIARDGTTVAGANYHSYGVMLTAASKFAIADIIGNAFEHPRRSALQIAGFTGDTYVYGNSFDATKLTTYYNGGSSGDGNELFPEMQIYAQGRIFIENNTFTGQYMTGAFGFYNKTTNKNTDAPLVFNGNTVDGSVPYLWTYYVDIASGGTTNVTGDLVMPDVYFGANAIGSGVDTTQGRYKELVQPVPAAYEATLALPTGVATVYDWAHGANADKMYVTPSGEGVAGFVNNLDDVAAGDTVIAIPGDVPTKANFTFTPGALKNQFTAALASYTITYMYGENALTGLTPATYTAEDIVTLPTEVNLGVVGVSFQNWTNAEGTVVTGWPAGGLTGDQVFYAQVAPVVAEEWTITYMFGDTVLEDLTPSNYTASVAVTLPTVVDLGVVGVSFQAWTNAEGTVVADWAAGDKTGNQVFYAQVTAVVPPAGTEPGAAVEGSPFASQAEAESAASSATVAVPAAVAAELTTEQQNAYKILFHAVVGEAVDGKYPVTMELTGEGAATIQSSADTAVAALAAKLTAAATAQQTVEVAAQPGFYYSIESGTEVSNLTEPQQRTLATGNTVELTMPTLGTKGFYRVKVSYEQLPPAPNN